MKRTLLALVISGLTLWLSPAQETKTSNPFEQTVLNLEQRWEDALTKSDTGALAELYDDTLIYTHSSGRVDTKSTYINAINSGATRYESMKRDDIKVSVYDRTAVVTCHWDVHILAQGNKVDLNARYLHVYVKQKDAWKLVAHQSTRITP
jgi:ketosteroid isomerase-like protein